MCRASDTAGPAPGRSLGTARIKPLASCGDPARVGGRDQMELAGWRGAPDTVARCSIQADDYPCRRAGDIATGARRGAWARRLGVETPRTQVLGRPVLYANEGSRRWADSSRLWRGEGAAAGRSQADLWAGPPRSKRPSHSGI